MTRLLYDKFIHTFFAGAPIYLLSADSVSFFISTDNG